MNAETLKALRKSIATWKRRASGKWIETGADNCALCKLFMRTNPNQRCYTCPVYNRTGYTDCKHTPYMDYEAGPLTADTNNSKNQAQDEVEFLKLLLPENEK